MESRPVLTALVAKILADGWVCLSELMPLTEATAKRLDDLEERKRTGVDDGSEFSVLVDPADEIALANFERENLPINRPRFRDTACNGE